MSNLTKEIVAEMMRPLSNFKQSPQFWVWNFTEQWRFPRTKKRRIRKKWERRPKNWRAAKGKIMHMTGTSRFIVGPDVYQALKESGHIQEPAPAPISNVHWVHVENEDSDEYSLEGENRCHVCCSKKVNELISRSPTVECSMDGGWDADYEVETPAHCEDCGEPLSCYLLPTNIDPKNWTEDERCLYDRSTHATSSAKFDAEQEG